MELNEDVLFLILSELQSSSNSLYSCLLVNKAWCKITIPILWNNPWKYLDVKKMESLRKVIISHLSADEAKEQLKSNLLVTRKIPLFNYISFIRHLNFYKLERVCNGFISDEILKLFINSNTKFTHLYMPLQFNCRLYHISGAEHCFSELKFLDYSAGNTNQNILEGLARIKSCSIRDLYSDDSIYSVVKLIEAQKNLNEVNMIVKGSFIAKTLLPLEESLIKHADTIQYLQITWWPVTNFLSHFVNLISLKVTISHLQLERNIGLDVTVSSDLRILQSYNAQSLDLARLIKNTNGYLTEISFKCRHIDKCTGLIIKRIYQNCPNLKYLEFFLTNNDNEISELEKLLTNCQYLDGLVIEETEVYSINLDFLFEILTKSSPASLFKFKFGIITSNHKKQKPLDSIKLFLDNWKGRHPMLLQTLLDISDQIKEYMVDGTVKKYDNFYRKNNEFAGFDWFQVDPYGPYRWAWE